MSVENILQEYNQVAMLAGILAGFAFSAVVQLISLDRRGRLMTATIIVFSLTTLILLISLLALVLMGAAVAELDRELVEINRLSTWAYIAALTGVELFLVGVGMAGWLRSVATGIATTILAVIHICLSLFVFFVVISVFARPG